MTPGTFAIVLQYTESDNDVRAYGDDGRVLTSFQAHPDWGWEWANHFKLPPRLGERWESWINRIVIEFAALFLPVHLPVEVAMHYHLGHPSDASATDWDLHYAERFNGYAVKFSSAAT